MGLLGCLYVFGPFQVEVHTRGGQDHILSLKVFMNRKGFGKRGGHVRNAQEPIKAQ